MPRVLVIDDNETSRFAIRAVLEHGDHEVSEAEAPEEALRVCDENAPDLLVVDTLLRGTNGPEVVRRLRQIVPEAPIIYISGFPLDQLVNRGLLDSSQVGSSDAAFLQKPFLPKALIEVADRLLAKRKSAGV